MCKIQISEQPEKEIIRNLSNLNEGAIFAHDGDVEEIAIVAHLLQRRHDVRAKVFPVKNAIRVVARHFRNLFEQILNYYFLFRKKYQRLVRCRFGLFDSTDINIFVNIERWNIFIVST